MKKILVVVDYQKDFVNGSLGFDKAATLEKAIGQKIEQYKQNGDEVVFALDTHNDNYLQTPEAEKPACSTLYQEYGGVECIRQNCRSL